MFVTYSSPSPTGVNTNEEKQLTEDEKQNICYDYINKKKSLKLFSNLTHEQSQLEAAIKKQNEYN